MIFLKATLTHCRNFILTYGTFGMWGALLSGSQNGGYNGGSNDASKIGASVVVLPRGYDHLDGMAQLHRANLKGWSWI